MEYHTADLFLPARLRALTENGCLRANEGAFAPLSGKIKVSILNRWLSRITRDRVVDQVAAVLAFALAGMIVWTASDSLG